MTELPVFDFAAFFAAFDTKRQNLKLGWYEFAGELWELSSGLNAQREDHGLTWVALAHQIGCTPNRLTNLRTARMTDMGLAMRVTQWLRKPAAAFIYPAQW